MLKAKKDKELNRLIPRCLLIDSQVWEKAQELADQEGRSVSSYLREQIKALYYKNKKLSSIS